MKSFIVPENLVGMRIDKGIAEYLDITRTKVKSLLDTSNVVLNSEIHTNAAAKLKDGDELNVTIPEPEPANITPADIPIDIIYEDDDLIVINKQSGLVVHPGAGNRDNTLVNALIFHYGKTLSDIGADQDRPGIVHRIDKDTSGLMVVAKNNESHLHLANQLADRSLSRKYLCLVWGMMSIATGVIDVNIGRQKRDRTKMQAMRFDGGKTAVTHYEVKNIYANGSISLIECKLETGRTHQIRVHMNHIAHSIVGDQTYGNNNRKILHSNLNQETKAIIKEFTRQALHSAEMSFIHPRTEEEMNFKTDPPEDLQKIIDVLKNHSQ